MFAIGVAWILCLILTLTNYFPNDTKSPSYRARTDAKIHVLGQVSWFKVPYPGKYTEGIKHCGNLFHHLFMEPKILQKNKK